MSTSDKPSSTPDYKATMNLPQTEFPMRAGLPVNEPLRLQKWAELDLYHKVLQQNEGNPPYVLHDGPPYANGPLHMGHAFNKVLKDIIVKYKSQRGFFAPYVPGWDCHGQPIEHMVETTLGPAKMAKIDQPTLRRLCRDWAAKYVDIQRDGFKRLGVTGEWDDPYLTYVPSYEAGNVAIFKAMYEAGAIYRGRKPIHWCRHCHTALAEAEIEYSDETSPSIYVAFELVDADKPGVFAAANAPLHILIWTTTPWTLPANTAVALAPEADYVVVLANSDSHCDGSNDHYGITNDTAAAAPQQALIMARALAPSVAAIAGWDVDGEGQPALLRDPQSGEPVTVKGSDLAGLHYQHPVHPTMQGVIVTGEHVELTTGTGAVHTAPGHGQEDYLMGVRYDLPLLMPVNDNGVFDAGGGPFEGLDVDTANPRIIDWLCERGSLVARQDITHSYPHCWRCHNPVIFRATDQWFVSMDNTRLREKALVELGMLNWYPDWAVNRLRSMVEGRPDWCISRQRSWGVPIPVFKCATCSATVATPATFDAVISLFEREGADAWFTRVPHEYLPEDTHCDVCGAGVHDLTPEKDILDVWWESGVSHTSVLKVRDYLTFPANLYLEGSDQHRGWFQSGLLTSVGAYGAAPYKGIMSCGFVVDGEGRKQSKSLGNVVDPAEVIAKSGADVLRLWVGSIDYSQDVGVDDEILQRTSEAYRRIRNTFRFLLANLDDFDAPTGTVTWDELAPFDRWALVRLAALMQTVTQAYDTFRFHAAYHAIYDYLVTDLSAIYLDALKDRLYSDAPASVARRSAQTVLMHVLEVLVRQLAPILTFTCDEVWDYYPNGLREQGREPAVQLAGWPEAQDFAPSPFAPPRHPAQSPAEAQREDPPVAILSDDAQKIERDFAVILTVREAVTKALEEARNAKTVGKSQEAAVTVTAPATVVDVLTAQAPGTLEEVFIVATVSCVADDTLSEPQVAVARAAGEKCPRCWNIRILGEDSAHPEVCPRCASVLEELGL